MRFVNGLIDFTTSTKRENILMKTYYDEMFLVMIATFQLTNTLVGKLLISDLAMLCSKAGCLNKIIEVFFRVHQMMIR